MDAPVRPGDVLAGKYRVERVLGKGGMGVVVAARHLQLGQIVALKFLLPESVADPQALDRFAREARNAVRLKSEHVARIIDVGTLDSGSPYIVMEYLEGSDLAAVLSQRRTLPIPVAADFVLQACDAIAEAHALGIIHRDLKPQNLFVTRRHDNTSLIKVLDFGISKSTAGTDFAATRTQAVMGTPAYMSPEQLRSAKFVDARTDVWSLGVILYQLVVGHVPWHAEALTELCLQIATDPLPPFPDPQQASFEAVVRRCLEKDPTRRFSSVHALAVALSPFAPAHAALLVERIGRVLQERVDEFLAPPLVDVNDPGTLRQASGQRMMRTAAGSRMRKLVALVATIGVLFGFVATAVVLGVRHGVGVVSESTSPPAVDHPTAPPAAASAPAQVFAPAPPSPSAPRPETPIVHAPVAEAPPPARVDLPHEPSTATKSHDKAHHRRTSIATPTKSITAAPPAATSRSGDNPGPIEAPAAPAATLPSTENPLPIKAPATPDPLSSPD